MCNLPFENNRVCAKDLLKIIHTDVRGPVNPTGYKDRGIFRLH